MRKIAALLFFLSGGFFVMVVRSLQEGTTEAGSIALILFIVALLLGISTAQK